MKYLVRKLFRRIRVFLVRTVLLLLLLCLMFTLYLGTIGFPGWLRNMVTARLSEGQLYIETRSIKLEFERGFVFTDLVVFRDRVVGPPAAEVDEAVVVPDFAAFLAGRLPVSKATASGVTVRPEMAISGTGEGEPRFNTYGSFDLSMRRIKVLGLHIHRLSCRMDISGPKLKISDASCSVGRAGLQGEARGSINHRMDTALMKGRGTTTFDLTLLIPVFQGLDMTAQSDLLSDFAFMEVMPRTEFEFTRLCKSDGFFDIDGAFWMEDCQFRDTPVERIDGRISGSFSPTNSEVRVRDLLLAREEGILRGRFDVKPREHTVQFRGYSSLDPQRLGRLVGVYPEEVMKELSFHGPVEIEAHGRVNYRDPARTRIDARVESRKLAVREFVTDTCSFDLLSTGFTNTLSNISGEIYEGEFTGNCRFVLPGEDATNVAYDCTGKIQEAELKQIISALTTNEEWDTHGEFKLELALSGQIGEGMGKTVKGSGEVKLREGRVFTMPLFGGFTDIMTRVIPGLDFVLSQSEVQAEFVVERNKIKSERVLIEGDILSLHAKGDYYFDNTLNYKVQVRLLKERDFVGKILQTLMWPLTTLFEFRLRGTLKDPRWYPVNFSDELLERLGVK